MFAWSAHKDAEQPGAYHEQQRRDQELALAHMLKALVAVIPRERQRDRKAHHKKSHDDAPDALRPGESVRL